MINQLPFISNDNNEYDPEKVYVDWPEDNSEDYRFISSRMEDVESDYYPLIAAEDIRRGLELTNNLSDLKFNNKPSRPIDSNARYEDLSSFHREGHKKSFIPSLDLVSQHSSIDIPGAKGAIDIDFRSTSDSMSEVNEDRVFDDPYTNTEGYRDNNEYPVAQRPSGMNDHADLRATLSKNPVVTQFDRHGQIYPEHEQLAFESVQQKFKHNLRAATRDRPSSPKNESTMSNKFTVPHKGKPTLLVAPQIKPAFHERAPNFVELNKDINQQRPMNQISYANQFADRHRKESPIRSLKKQTSSKDVSNIMEKVDRNPTLSANEYWNKRERSIERLTRERVDSGANLDDHMQYRNHSQHTPQLIYAFTQYGEPLIIKSHEIIVPHHGIKNPLLPDHPECFLPPSMGAHNTSNSIISPRIQRSPPQIKMRKSFESDHSIHDDMHSSSFNRQPTLYDESLLNKKTKLLSSDRNRSNLPSLPTSSDSNINRNNGYGASLHKEVHYQQYTLRDFRNIKQIYTTGGLGPNLGTETHRKMKEKLLRQKNYSKAVQEKNQELSKKQAKWHLEDFPQIMDPSGEKESHNGIIDQDHYSEQNDPENVQWNAQADDKSTAPSLKYQSKEAGTKRDVMINYSKSVKEKKSKKHLSKNITGESQPSVKTDKEGPKVTLELFNNADLEKLLQRHECDKRVADQIRQKWEKI